MTRCAACGCRGTRRTACATTVMNTCSAPSTASRSSGPTRPPTRARTCPRRSRTLLPRPPLLRRADKHAANDRQGDTQMIQKCSRATKCWPPLHSIACCTTSTSSTSSVEARGLEKSNRKQFEQQSNYRPQAGPRCDYCENHGPYRDAPATQGIALSRKKAGVVWQLNGAAFLVWAARKNMVTDVTKS